MNLAKVAYSVYRAKMSAYPGEVKRTVGNTTICTYCDCTELANDGEVWFCTDCKRSWRPATTTVQADGKRQIGYL